MCVCGATLRQLACDVWFTVVNVKKPLNDECNNSSERIFFSPLIYDRDKIKVLGNNSDK